MPYLFGVHQGSLPRTLVRRIRAIADREDVDFITAEGRCWFSSRSHQLGEPFDSALARRVFDALDAAGVDFRRAEKKG